MKRFLGLTLAFLLLSGGFFAYSQCRGYTKRKCIPSLKEYTHDGKMNFVQLYAGDKAEIKLTFYSGQKYRLLTCTDFEEVTIIVKDTDGNPVFKSEGKSMASFDFRMGSTQQLVVEIKVPYSDNTTHELDMTGCVSIITGVKS